MKESLGETTMGESMRKKSFWVKTTMGEKYVQEEFLW